MEKYQEIGVFCNKKKFLHLWRERNAGRLNKHTMRKLFSIYGNFIEYVNKLYEVGRNAVAVVGMDEKAVLEGLDCSCFSG